MDWDRDIGKVPKCSSLLDVSLIPLVCLTGTRIFRHFLVKFPCTGVAKSALSKNRRIKKIIERCQFVAGERMRSFNPIPTLVFLESPLKFRPIAKVRESGVDPPPPCDFSVLYCMCPPPPLPRPSPPPLFPRRGSAAAACRPPLQRTMVPRPFVARHNSILRPWRSKIISTPPCTELSSDYEYGTFNHVSWTR